MNLHEVFLASQMSGASEENFVHIETLEISTDGVSMLKRSNEPDGTPYDFKKVLIRIIVPKSTSTSAGQINLNSSSIMMWREDMISAASDTVSVVKAEIKNGMLDGFGLVAKEITERANPSYRSDVLFTQCERIHTISVFTEPMSANLPFGTTIEIYAVRN